MISHFRSALPVVLAVLLCSCGEKSSTPTAPVPPRDVTKSERALLNASNTFGFGLMRTLNAEAADDNIFVSPLSVSLALGMTLNGAAGDTRTAMEHTLALSGLTQEEINRSYRSVIDLLRGLDPAVRFDIANSIWTRLGFPVRPTFLELNRTWFDAETRELDFATPQALPTINGWVNEKTNGKIPTILDDPIAPDVVMYLINAIYFKGNWTTQFNPKSTSQKPFFGLEGQKTVDMMSRQSDMQYYEDDAVQVVDLPYGNGRYSMTVVLPALGRRIDEVTRDLDDATWNRWTAGVEKREILLSLPKFRLEYRSLLNDALTAMGMGVAFTGSADFSGISEAARLAISRVIHKTFVDVNEEGTEAAAVTAVEIRETSVPEYPVMTVNRPFLFAIREHHTGSILFLGKITSLGR